MYCNINKNYSTPKSVKPQNVAGKKICAQSFGGFTRFVKSSSKREIPFLSTQDFLRISAPFKSKVVGKLPPEFLTLFPNEPQKLFEFFGQFANFSRSCSSYFNDFRSFKIKTSSGKSISSKSLGSGTYGICTKMTLKGKSPYVFKAFFDDYADLCQTSSYKHGGVAEVRTGLNFSSSDYADFAKWHIGSIEDERSWQIMDFLDEKNINTFLWGGNLATEEKAYLTFEDSANFKGEARNQINGVRYDLGGIFKDMPQMFLLNKNFMTFFDAKDRVKTYYELLNDPNFQSKRKLGYLIRYLPLESRKQCFYATLDHPDSEIRRNVRLGLQHLKKDDRKDAFYALLYSPNSEVRKRAGEEVQYLYSVDKPDAFTAVKTHPDPEVKDGLWADIRWLHQDENIHHLNEFYETKFTTFRIKI